MTGIAMRMFLEGPGWRNGLCSRYKAATDELIHVARELRHDLERFKQAPDPFAALVSTVHNNQEFGKFLEHLVDTGTKPGVQASPITTAPGPTR